MFTLLYPQSEYDQFMQRQHAQEQAYKRQLYLRRQEQLHQQRLLELARSQQRRKSPSPKKRAAFVPAPWRSVPMNPVPSDSGSEDSEWEADDTATPPSGTRVIPIQYANEISSQEAPTTNEPMAESTSTEDDVVDSCCTQDDASDVDMDENLEPLTADLQEFPLAESQTPTSDESLLLPITELADSFHSEFPSTEWPSRLANISASLKVDSSTQKLVLGAKENMPLLEVEEKLTKLLLKADTIESNGCVEVRNRRRMLVKEVQGLLDQVEEVKRKATGSLPQ
ncbi:hypothetical protein HDU98_008707 [Podochytrium sp. JEL0797]|nr:hypothetical protein HDU98_008707 [Podochytrium sp. JEL0797]